MNITNNVITRFAPSPTGYLHIGNIRTALFSWLYAKHLGGKFLLRIEDTDQERSTKEATQVILNAMEWLGLEYDIGPIYQSDRLTIYKEVAKNLLETGHVYKCYCSKERLDQLREEQIAKGLKPKYDGYCKHRQRATNESEEYVIRFNNPDSGTVSFEDKIYGKLSFNNEELDDLVIVRKDGFPTYNFAVVIDDSEMNVTHIIRGADHINNTPRQINILNAMKKEIPTYAHVPMMLGSDGKLLSKRHGALSIMQYRDDGYLPEAILNYLVRLGWSDGNNEIFNREEMIERFDVANISKSPATFNDSKLVWLNKYYMKNLSLEYISDCFSRHIEKSFKDKQGLEKIKNIVSIQRERCETLKEMYEKSRFFFSGNIECTCPLPNESEKSIIDILISEFSFIEPESFKKENIYQILKNVSTREEKKFVDIVQPIRRAISGTDISPPIDSTLEILGKKETIDRLHKYVESTN